MDQTSYSNVRRSLNTKVNTSDDVDKMCYTACTKASALKKRRWSNELSRRRSCDGQTCVREVSILNPFTFTCDIQMF